MAQATVFVDDAVLGRLPSVCAKDGVPTADTLILHSRVGDGTGLGVAWLLVLAGPLGWLVLLIIAATRRPADTLTVQLPFSEGAYQRLHRAKRELWPVAIGVPIFLILCPFALGHDERLLAAVLGLVLLLAIVRWAVIVHRIRALSVTVTLDASRRWVTLGRVHEAFAQSCMGGPRPPARLDVWSQSR